MIDLKQYEVWFVTGSQHLYGPKTLETVAEHSRAIAAALGASKHLPVKVVFKPVLTTPDAIRELCLEANSSKSCIGLITWMHTFSPAKMWIAGLTLLKKPFATFTYAIQPRNSLVNDRYGFHESKSGRTRRP